MKFFFIVLATLTVIFSVAQLLIMKISNDTETYVYKVLKNYDAFEIRKYDASNFSYVTMKSSSYQENSGQGFKSLAGYIFGGNDKNESIAMTSPVVVNLSDTITMQFMVPSKYKLEELPTPNNPNIKFKVEKEKFVAAISFGGWSNDQEIKKYTLKLKDLLNKNGIMHFNNFSYFGYNPPFQMVNRRNEIVVEIDINSVSGLDIKEENY